MASERETPQWCLAFTVLHSPMFGHRLEVCTKQRGREEEVFSLGSWHGLSIPEDVFNGALTRVWAIMSEHLAYRYGVQLQHEWPPEPEVSPF